MPKPAKPKKENINNTSLHLFSPTEGMTLLQTIQSWRGDPRLDEWKEHFLSSLAHRMYVAGREFDLSADQVEKLEEIREVMTGYARRRRGPCIPMISRVKSWTGQMREAVRSGVMYSSTIIGTIPSAQRNAGFRPAPRLLLICGGRSVQPELSL